MFRQRCVAHSALPPRTCPGAPALVGPWAGAPVEPARRSSRQTIRRMLIGGRPTRSPTSSRGSLVRPRGELRLDPQKWPAVGNRATLINPRPRYLVVCHAGAFRVVPSLGRLRSTLVSEAMLGRLSGGIVPFAASVWPKLGSWGGESVAASSCLAVFSAIN